MSWTRIRSVSRGTSDAAIGQSNLASSDVLTEGDLCAPERCEGQAFATPADGTTPTETRCVAGPQVGSGVGVCQLQVLQEGDLCPEADCAGQAVSCTSEAGQPELEATNLRCVAGPQAGSGVGVCNLLADCVPAP